MIAIHDAPDEQIKKELIPELTELLKETVKNLKLQLNSVDSKPSVKEYNKEEVITYLQEVQEDVQYFKAVSQERVESLENMLASRVDGQTVKALNASLLGYKYKEADKMINEIYKLLMD